MKRTNTESFLDEIRGQVEQESNPYVISKMMYSSKEGQIHAVVLDVLSDTPRVVFRVTSGQPREEQDFPTLSQAAEHLFG